MKWAFYLSLESFLSHNHNSKQREEGRKSGSLNALSGRSPWAAAHLRITTSILDLSMDFLMSKSKKAAAEAEKCQADWEADQAHQ